MNQISQSMIEREETDVGVWSLPGDLEAFPLPPSRRRRRSLSASRAEFIWSVLTLSLLVWMTLVALTLWH
jgi:hypothetical protein